MVKRVVYGLSLAAIAAMLWVSVAYFRDKHHAYERIRGQSTVSPSAYGAIEYLESGSGPPVLVVHGSGGGYDQGELIARAVLDDRFRWIAPSRFGYLRSTLPEGATWDDQAHAYAQLLDHLGIRQAAVVALSHGGPSALLFAVLYPDRVASLTLISCGVAPSSASEQGQANQKGAALTTIFKYDLLYWAVAKLFKRQLMALMGANDAVIAGLSPEQRRLIERFIEDMNPVAPRAAGVAFDHQARLPGERIAAISAPTLILHASDDTLQLYHNAEFAAATIPNARLVRFDRGGHFVIGVEQAAVSAAVRAHILDHARADTPAGNRR